MRIGLERFTEIVLTLMNEGPLPAAIRGEGETLVGAIREVAGECATQALLEAPLDRLSPDEDFSALPSEVEWLADGAGRILLPADFLRLVALRMSDWRRTLTAVTDTGSAMWRRQSSPFKLLRGTTRQPVCGVVPLPAGRALEFHSCRSESASVETGLYLPHPGPDSEGMMRIPEGVLTAAANYAAKRVMLDF